MISVNRVVINDKDKDLKIQIKLLFVLIMDLFLN